MLSLIKKIKDEAGIVGIALFIVAAIVPIIIRRAVVPVDPNLMHILRSTTYIDMFSYHKSRVLMVCAVIILLYKIADVLITWPDSAVLKSKVVLLLKSPIVIISAVYLFFVLLSNLLSPYPHTALWGLHDRHEGLFVQLAYFTVFFATMFHVNGQFRIKVLLSGFLFSSIIMGVIGFSQFINMDIVETQFFAWLAIGPGARPMETRFDMAYGTNFNPNPFGLVTAMLFPTLFATAIAWSNRIWRGLFLLAGVLMVIGVIASRSVGGLIGASAAITAIVVTLGARWIIQRVNQKDKKVFSRKIAIILSIGLVGTVATGIALRDYIYNDLFFTLGRISAIFEPPQLQHPEFIFEDNVLTVTDREITYQIIFPLTPGIPEVFTAEGVAIEPVIEPSGSVRDRYYFNYDVPGFRRPITIMRQGPGYLYRRILMMVEGNTLYLTNWGDELVDPNVYIPSWGFEGWETWGSNRGFIFARSIPLLSQNIFIGSGSDTFVFQFPQHDILSKARYFGDPYILVDKAHNLFLQTTITTGMISALALYGLFGFYILTTFWSLVRHSRSGQSEEDKTSKEEFSFFCMRVGIMASVTAFSVSSLSTDSTVSSTPMFWLIIGMGFALNRCVEYGDATILKER